jgi:hypothetical protein
MEPVRVRYKATVDGGAASPSVLENVVLLDAGSGVLLERKAVLVVGGTAVYLPITRR